MTTGGKILVGTAVVAGGYLLYKAVSTPSLPSSAPSTRTNGAANTGGPVSSFLNFGSSVLNYFTKTQPSGTAVSGTSYTVPADAFQSSAASQAYADSAGGVLPANATDADYESGNVVYGPFV